MTHDKLLAKLLISDETDLYKTLRLWQASLYAVVELHKPNILSIPVPVCCACAGFDSPIYPCLTIQAIEKELNG